MSRQSYDIGELVNCDFCNEDYSTSDTKGGILFCSHAACPKCAVGIEATAKRHGESHLIKARPTEGESFRDFVLRLRGGNNTVTIVTGRDLEEVLGCDQSA